MCDLCCMSNIPWPSSCEVVQHYIFILLRRHYKGKDLANLLMQQARAKHLKLGMWQGSFQDPQDWKNDPRHQHDTI